MNEKLEKLHVAIIPDGNRRWAKRRLLKPWKGHEEAITRTSRLLEWTREDGRIGTLTLWGLSTENWNRSKEELMHLMTIYEQFLQSQRPRFQKENIRFVHTGRNDRIPASLKKLIREIVRETATFGKLTLNFALDYGGRDALIRAIHRIPDVNKVTEESFAQFLDHPELPDIDIIIRTSGEQRLSNFFFWEAAYAELFFVNKLYPDFSSQDLNAILTQFQQRQRRFGA